LWQNFLQSDVYADQNLPPEPPPEPDAGSLREPDPPAKMIIMGKLSNESTDWVQENIPEYATMKHSCILATKINVVGVIRYTSLTTLPRLYTQHGTKAEKQMHT
jgi:hypothetical protein